MMSEEIGAMDGGFQTLKRQQFRRFFQPSRIVLGIFPPASGVTPNVITLCFHMYCSYKPDMVAFSVQKGAYTHELLRNADECVLSVPGEHMARETLFCGRVSGRTVNKFLECGFDPVSSQTINVPGLRSAIANIEVRLINRLVTGDHLTVVGQVRRFAVNVANTERCLVSVGPNTQGFQVLARHGIHRIAVVENDHTLDCMAKEVL